MFHSLTEFLGCFLELLGGCEEFSKFVVRQRVIWLELDGLPEGVFSSAGFIRAREENAKVAVQGGHYSAVE